jgi:hypothetical protein
MAIKAPDENAKKYCKTPLNLTATSPPVKVDMNVMKASTNNVGVIRMHYIGVVINLSIYGINLRSKRGMPCSHIVMASVSKESSNKDGTNRYIV